MTPGPPALVAIASRLFVSVMRSSLPVKGFDWMT
jgi:hypothetical protein